MNIDLIVQYCVYSDYPVWRMNIQKYRDQFNKVILYPSKQHGRVDFEAFAKRVIPETWVTPVAIDYGVEDWRQAETIPCLKESNSDWIFFNEQDFFVRNWERFFLDINKVISEGADMIGIWNPTHFPYVHPSCLFIKRDLLEKTQKDFSAHSEINGADHFAMLTKNAQDLGAKIVTLQDIGYKDWEDMFHLGGLTYVYQDWKGDGTDAFGVKNPEVFYVYNYWSRRANVEQSTEYKWLSHEVQDVLEKKFPSVDPETSRWKPFFTT